MPYGECPTCGQKYHLRVGDPKEWYRERGLAFGDLLIEKCYFCWKDLKEYDVVEVISKPEGNEEIEIGDIGTVLIVHDSSKEHGAYEVECVLEDGTNKWLTTLKRENIRYDAKLNKPKADQGRVDNG